jgi:hypothetical protein
MKLISIHDHGAIFKIWMEDLNWTREKCEAEVLEPRWTWMVEHGRGHTVYWPEPYEGGHPPLHFFVGKWGPDMIDVV